MNNKNRIPSSLITRDPKKEAFFGIKNITYYAYKNDENSLTIVGQIFADKDIKEDFRLILIIYDNDGNVMISQKSEAYGSISGMIKSESFFDGFPFKFRTEFGVFPFESRINNMIMKKISRIEITPEFW